MEKIAAASAMAWSIGLEKGLRFKCPDKRIKAIEQMGPILQTWSTEPNITKDIADMYGLVPGEDRAFANTILLRLANEFKLGDNYTRRCILKVFLLELARISTEGRRYNGILAKRRVPNYIELLKRVKVVYDTADTEAKTLALRLFGCWADFAKDSSHIRYIILLSLQSSNISEVKASLFAAGCFSLLAEDFACIALGILLNIVSLPQFPSDVSIAAIHALSRMRCSPAVASKAYRAGRQLLSGSSSEEFKAAVLSSLSTLAFRSTNLIDEQVGLLLLFLSNDAASLVKSRALKCLYFLFGSHACHFTLKEGVIMKLLQIVGDDDEQFSDQQETIMILCKVFNSMLPTMPYVNLLVLVKRVLVMAEQHSSKVKSTLLELLVFMFCNLKRVERGHCWAVPVNWCRRCYELQRDPVVEVLPPEVDSSGLACQVISVIADYVTFLIKQRIANSRDEDINKETALSCTEFKQELRKKLRLIQLLAREYPLAPLVVLDRMRQVIQFLEDMYYNSTMGSIHAQASEEDFEKKRSVLQVCCNSEDLIDSQNAVFILRFMIACIKKINDTSTLKSEVCQKLKPLVECMQQSKYYHCATYELFCLYMDSYIAFLLDGTKNNQAQVSDKLDSGSLGSSYYILFWVNQEWKSLGSIRNMLENRNYWAAYRAGKYCCLEGLWFAATFTFRKLIDHVASVYLSCWLKCLMLLAGSESEIKLLLFPKVGIALVNGLQTVNHCDKTFTSISGDNFTGTNLCGWEGKFAKIYGRIYSAEETLASAGVSDNVYYFQRWFLHLRANFLKILVDIIGLLSSLELNLENIGNKKGKGQVYIKELRQKLSTLMSGFAYESLRFNSLAKDYDLLASSFLDIDSQSFRRISTMALSCSLLSFCTAFAMHFPCLSVYKDIASCNAAMPPNFSCNMILKDLIQRFGTIDQRISEQLQKLMTAFCKDEDHSCRGSCTCTSGHIERSTLHVYEFAVSGILCIQENAKRVKKEEDLVPLLLRGLQLLSDIIRRWLEIPFQIPKYFFIVRPCIGAELFILNANTRNKGEIFVSQGSQMSLNICIQLKKPSRISFSQVTKMYCILAAKQSKQLSTDKRREDSFNADKIDEMVELNNMLLMFVKANTRKANKMRLEDSSADGWVTSCLSFEPNRKGQGFASCLLDVSAFPEGSYEIKWHSCCIDESGSYWSLLPLTAGVLFTVRKF
ncbi:hypothetical protein Cni_G06174 [Canna indica]|uniref:ARM repeat superfamily protein n=1 Tax=Canna indica TaxID=4628 RepID=A0AAQ3JZG8_9LILI|nr:hypothetical protein Cni_G06174 [Canna indica]